MAAAFDAVVLLDDEAELDPDEESAFAAGLLSELSDFAGLDVDSAFDSDLPLLAVPLPARLSVR